MVRRRTLIRAGLAAAAVGIAGCGSEGETEGAGDDETESTAGATTATGTGTATAPPTTTADQYGTAPPVGETAVDDPVVTERPRTTAVADDPGSFDGPFEVTSAVGTAIDQRRVGVVRLRIAAAPGARVDTSTIRVRWLDPSGAYTVIASSSVDDTDAYFGIHPLSDENESVPVLDDPSDEFELVFDLGENDTFVDDPRPAADHPGKTDFAEKLAEGAVVSVQLATGAGQSITRRLRIPDGIGGESEVDIRVSR